MVCTCWKKDCWWTLLFSLSPREWPTFCQKTYPCACKNWGEQLKTFFSKSFFCRNLPFPWPVTFQQALSNADGTLDHSTLAWTAPCSLDAGTSPLCWTGSVNQCRQTNGSIFPWPWPKQHVARLHCGRGMNFCPMFCFWVVLIWCQIKDSVFRHDTELRLCNDSADILIVFLLLSGLLHGPEGSSV